MIHVFTAAAHGYTCKGFAQTPGPKPELVQRGYGWLFEQKSLRSGAVIFTDFDRLNYDQTCRADRIARTLQNHGVRVLNRPSFVRCRYELLRHLHASGKNPVRVYHATDRPKLSRDNFPVFLKSEGDHRQPVGGLIKTQAELEARLNALPTKGIALTHVLIISFANSETRPGIWRRYTTYRIGSRVFAGLAVTEDSPFVKHGRIGLATEDDFEDALTTWRENRFSEWASAMFDAARIEYGRADFGLLNGKPVLFEINTNPDIPYKHDSRSPKYLLASRATQSFVNYAVAALDRPDVDVDLSKINRRKVLI